ncbi:hypothetical protein MEO41_28215 [Dolichospermum sp. ST_sed4]|nr:hypothetical protein [Dolichospermum sp. ST_sed4]
MAWKNNDKSAKIVVVAKEMVETPVGIFEDCYKIDVYFAAYGGDYSDYYYYGEYPWYSIWLARGVVPLKLV